MREVGEGGMGWREDEGVEGERRDEMGWRKDDMGVWRG